MKEKRETVIYNIYEIIRNSLFISLLALIAIKYDIHTYLINIIHNNVFISVIFLILLIVLYCKKIIEFFKLFFTSKKWNIIDNLICEIIIIFILMFLYTKLNNIKTFIIIFIILFIRIIARINIWKKNKREEFINTISLSDAYNNNFKNVNKKLIRIKDEPSEVDLLGMNNFIEELSKQIKNTYPDNVFSIGLDGKWGSGKTSIMKMVLKKISKKDFIIVQFDPCKYGNNESLIEALYNEIAKKLNIEKDFKYKYLIKEVICEVFSIKKVNIITDIVSKWYDIIGNLEINTIIQEKLLNLNKRMIIVVDNLDRADKEIMEFFLRSIYAINNFKNTIYLLLYDSEILNKHFQEKYKDSKLFMSKIINVTVTVPSLNYKNKKEIANKIINNLINKKIIKTNKRDRLDNITFFQYSRELIEIINRLIFNNKIMNDLSLDPYDYLALYYIKITNINLFNIIKNNKTILTTSNNKSSKEQEIVYVKQLNESLKVEEYRYQQILKNMFSNFSYSILYNIQGEETFENRIQNPNYFDMYFEICENEYFSSSKETDKLVKILEIKSSDSISEIKKYLFDSSLSMYNIQKIIIIIDNNNKIKYDLLFNGIYLILESNEVKDYNVLELLKKLIDKIDDNCFDTYLKTVIEPQKYWVNYEISKGYNTSERKQKIINTLNQTTREIVNRKQKVNILEKEFYSNNNIRAFFASRLDTIKIEEIENYLIECINENTVFNYLKINVISSFNGKKYKYSIGELEETANKKINEILRSKSAANELERTLIQIFYEKEYEDQGELIEILK